MGAGVYDHGYVLGYERIRDHAPEALGPRHRLWRVRAGHVITATGAIERPLSFAGNDVPGVMLASAMRDYVANYGVSPGDRTVLVTNNDNAYLTAIALKQAGLDVPAVLDARVLPQDSELVAKAKALGIRVVMGHAVSSVQGGKRVTGVRFTHEGRALRDRVDTALESLREDGTLTEISDKWLGTDITKAE